MAYKKMAGTAAVFVSEKLSATAAVERDGLVWQPEQLALQSLPKKLNRKPAMANSLALEGLAEYDPPSCGDVRYVNALAEDFVYVEASKAWVHILKT